MNHHKAPPFPLALPEWRKRVATFAIRHDFLQMDDQAFLHVLFDRMVVLETRIDNKSHQTLYIACHPNFKVHADALKTSPLIALHFKREPNGAFSRVWGQYVDEKLGTVELWPRDDAPRIAVPLHIAAERERKH